MGSQDRASPLWAITAYFNPMHWQRRLANYRLFRERLTLPLVTVELGYLPHFQLAAGDAEVLIHYRGRDILWQKERLLNLALQALPRECEAVAWLDADVLFTADDWPRRALRDLDRCVLVQPFQDVVDLGRACRVEDGARARANRKGLAFQVATGVRSAESIVELAPAYAPGLAWVGRRAVLDRFGFYDACIVGGADRAILAAAHGTWNGLEATHRWNPRQVQHYLDWARPFFASVAGQVGFIEGKVVNLWHGEVTNRAYVTRFQELAAFDFDPYQDIAADEQGCWRWNSAKTALHEHVRSYFARRQEDGGS